MSTEKAESLSLDTRVENSEELPPVPALESLASFNIPSPIKFNPDDKKMKVSKRPNCNEGNIENFDELSLLSISQMHHSNKRRLLNNGEVEKLHTDTKPYPNENNPEFLSNDLSQFSRNLMTTDTPTNYPNDIYDSLNIKGQNNGLLVPPLLSVGGPLAPLQQNLMFPGYFQSSFGLPAPSPLMSFSMINNNFNHLGNLNGITNMNIPPQTHAIFGSQQTHYNIYNTNISSNNNNNINNNNNNDNINDDGGNNISMDDCNNNCNEAIVETMNSNPNELATICISDEPIDNNNNNNNLQTPKKSPFHNSYVDPKKEQLLYQTDNCFYTQYSHARSTLFQQFIANSHNIRQMRLSYQQMQEYLQKMEVDSKIQERKYFNNFFDAALQKHGIIWKDRTREVQYPNQQKNKTQTQSSNTSEENNQRVETNTNKNNNNNNNNKSETKKVLNTNMPLKKKKRTKKPKFSEYDVRVFADWYNMHLDNPYPSKQEKQMMAELTNLTRYQVSRWFCNARTRRPPPPMDTNTSTTMSSAISSTLSSTTNTTTSTTPIS